MYLLRKGDYYNFPVEHETLNGVIYVETEKELRKALKDHFDSIDEDVLEDYFEIDWDNGEVDFETKYRHTEDADAIYHTWKLDKLVKP